MDAELQLHVRAIDRRLAPIGRRTRRRRRVRGHHRRLLVHPDAVSELHDAGASLAAKMRRNSAPPPFERCATRMPVSLDAISSIAAMMAPPTRGAPEFIALLAPSESRGMTASGVWPSARTTSFTSSGPPIASVM